MTYDYGQEMIHEDALFSALEIEHINAMSVNKIPKDIYLSILIRVKEQNDKWSHREGVLTPTGQAVHVIDEYHRLVNNGFLDASGN